MNGEIREEDGDFMRRAEGLATCSPCLKAQYGALLVDRQGFVVSWGFNRKPLGNRCARVCFRREPVPDRSFGCCLHAERVCIKNAKPADRDGGTLYVTGIPCKDCALEIMDSGIVRLVYADRCHSPHSPRVSDDAFWETYGVPVERVRFTWEEWERRFGS